MNVKEKISTSVKASPGENAGAKVKATRLISPAMKMHRKQAFWQIAFPLMIGCLIVLGLAAWVIISSSPNHDISLNWANLSLIVLIILFSLLGLLDLGLIIGGIYGVAKLKYYTPIYTQVAQTYIYRISALIIEYADHSVKPVLSIHSGLSGFKAFIKWITHINPAQKDKA